MSCPICRSDLAGIVPCDCADAQAGEPENHERTEQSGSEKSRRVAPVMRDGAALPPGLHPATDSNDAIEECA